MKERILRMARRAGAFALAGRFTAKRARILCYHGFSLHDEAAFKPKLFMRPETFRARLDLIDGMGFKVIGLDELLRRLKAGEPVGDLVALTFDDGWLGFYLHAWPELRKRGWPCTLYVTTYCVEKRLRVMNNAVQYLLWASPQDEVDLRNWSEGRLGVVRKQGGKFPLRDEDAITDDVERSPAGIREGRLAGLAGLLGIDAERWHSGMFRLCEPAQLAEMAQAGVDLQLHTHRHRLGLSAEEIRFELEENRRVLGQAAPGPFRHFCYPSGEYSPKQFAHLDAAGIATATTTDIGLVPRDAHPLTLPRILDGENVTPLEFEAELSGFLSLMRRGRRLAGKGYS